MSVNNTKGGEAEFEDKKSMLLLWYEARTIGLNK